MFGLHERHLTYQKSTLRQHFTCHCCSYSLDQPSNRTHSFLKQLNAYTKNRGSSAVTKLCSNVHLYFTAANILERLSRGTSSSAPCLHSIKLPFDGPFACTLQGNARVVWMSFTLEWNILKKIVSSSEILWLQCKVRHWPTTE